MKSLRVRLAVVLPVFALVAHSNAASFMGHRHESLVGKAMVMDRKDMPLVKHSKTAGDGYKPGSPLYKTQQAAGSSVATPVAPVEPVVPLSEAVPTGMPDPGIGAVTLPDARTWIGPWQRWRGHGVSKGQLLVNFGLFVQFFVFVMFIALIWEKCIGRNRTGYEERQNTPYNFAYGLFSLDHCIGSSGHHAHVCFCAWCCPWIRLADTYAKQPFPLIGNFWMALILVTCLIGLYRLTFGLSVVIFFGLALYYRQQLRRQYGLESGGKTLVEDCCTWFLCPCCAIAQEARQVEFVKKLGDPGK